MQQSQKKQRVLMLLENNAYSKDVRVRQEAQSLHKHGYNVTVICPKTKDEGFFIMNEGVRLYQFPSPPGGSGVIGYAVEYGYAMIVSFFMTLYIFLRHGFDIIHAHNPPDTFFLLALLYRPLGKKFIYDHHDLSPELYYYSRFGGGGNKKMYQLLTTLENASCRTAHHVIATNESYRDIEMTRAGVPAERISIVRNGPKTDHLHPLDRAENPEQTPITIGYLGIMAVQDGVDNLLMSIHHLVNDFSRTDFRCLIVGSGSALDDLKAQAKTLNLDAYVQFIGWIPYSEVNTYLNQFDICVAPEIANEYTERCTMIKMMEYMAVARPIVAFDLIEHRRTAEDAALYAADNNPRLMAEHIVALMDDPQRREKMGEIGRDRIENVLSWAHQEKSLLKAYQSLEN
ncbi:MAG: glycosyltransferase family 4 protein [Aggregatilineales bacterium]